MESFAIAAYGGILGVFAAAAGLTSDSFKAMWVVRFSGGIELVLQLMRIAFFFEMMVLAVAWTIATKTEMGLWIEYLDNPWKTVEREQVYGAIITLAIVLGVALAFPYNAPFITFFMTAVWLINYWTQWLCIEHFSKSTAKARTDHRVLSAMEHYWMELPHLGRIATMMFFGSISFSLAFASIFVVGFQKTLLQLLAYCILFTDILVGEIIIWRWRSARNRQIEIAERTRIARHAKSV